MNRNKKCLKMMGVLLASAMVVSGTGIQETYAKEKNSQIEETQKEEKKIIFLDGEEGSDKNSGLDREHPVKTFKKAVKLAKKGWEIQVCGTITVEEDAEETWELPENVGFDKAEGFTDPVVRVQGSLTLENIVIYERDITGEGQVEGAYEEKVLTPRVMTAETPVALKELSLEDCKGEGTFVWEDPEFIPQQYETESILMFYPDEDCQEDFHLEEGWDEDLQMITRRITIRIASLCPEEDNEENAQENPVPEEEPEMPSQGTEDSGNQEPVPTPGGEEPETPSQGAEGGGNQEPAPTPGGEEPEMPSQGAEDGGNQEPAPTPGGEEPETPAQGAEDSGNQEPVPTPGEEGTEDSSSEAGDDEKEDLISPGQEEDREPGADDSSQNEGTGQQTPGNSEEQTEDTLTEEESAKAAAVQKFMEELPEEIRSQQDVQNVLEATRGYLGLSDGQREVLSSQAVRKLEKLQQLSAEYNRVSNGVSIEGTFPWYVQLQVELRDDKESILPENTLVDTLIAPYEIRLWDLMNQQEYQLNGQQVRLTIPAPDEASYSQLVVLHYLEDGRIEYISPVNNGDGTISFLTTSFSPYSLAGSAVLVGNTDKLYHPVSTGGIGYTEESLKGGSSSSKKETSTSASSGSQHTSSGAQVQAVNTNDPQNPYLYAGLGIFALAILSAAAVGYRRNKKKTENLETKE